MLTLPHSGYLPIPYNEGNEWRGNMSSHKPKVVVLGAGSLFFGRQSIWQMVHSEHLNKGTLALVDTNEVRLNKMVKLARMVAEANNVELRIEGSTDRKQVLKDADFVVLSFAEDTVKYRGIDCAISEKYGIRMCSGDTIGPGGIFRAMRELPVIMECARDIEAICPEAWVINYINPSTVNGMALSRYAPKLKSFALCDSHHMPHKKIQYAERAGIIQDKREYTSEIDHKFEMQIAGVNHFTWLLKAEYEGQDVLPAIAESMKRTAETETLGGDTGAKAIFNDAISYQLYDIFGSVPTCTGHSKEYLPYWQGLGKLKDTIPPLSIWETEDRYKRHADMWQQVDQFLADRLLPHRIQRVSHYMLRSELNMSSMGSVGSYGANMGMGKAGVGGMHTGPNAGPHVSAAGYGPSAYTPAYANPGYTANPAPYANPGYAAYPAPVAPAYVAGVGVGFSSTGIILVLYILLVLISRSVVI
jgi:alpha-galactosidase